MKSPTTLAAVGVAVLCWSVAPSWSGGRQKKDEPTTTTFDPIRVEDSRSKITAARLLVPRGWKTEGDVLWHPQMAHQARLAVRAFDPNGAEHFQTLPTPIWTHMTNPVVPPKTGSVTLGQVYHEPLSPAEVVEKLLLPAYREKYSPKVVKSIDLPDVAAGVEKQLKAKVRAGRTRVEYRLGDRAVEEDFYLVLKYETFRDATVGAITIWQTAVTPFAVRAEKGKLDAASPRLLTVALSASAAPEFTKHVYYAQQLFLGRTKAELDANYKDARAVLETFNAVNAIYKSAREHREALSDRRFRETQDLLGGVAPYSPATGGNTSYILPYQDGHYWVNPNGTVIHTTDRNFDPNVGSTTSWSQLEGVRRQP